MLVVLVWRRRVRRWLYMGLKGEGALHPIIAWSTLLLQASQVVPFYLSSGATVDLSSWPRALQSSRCRLLHLELHLDMATLLGPRHRLAASRRR
jgi:hypothetical protein